MSPKIGRNQPCLCGSGLKFKKCCWRRSRPTPRWHLDEMAVTIAGRQFWLWRAVDDEGDVLDLLVQRRRNQAAAVKLMRKLSRFRLVNQRIGFLRFAVAGDWQGVWHGGKVSGYGER